MIQHELYSKGEEIYALLSSKNNPNILIPVKGIIKDLQFDELNPKYLIKIVNFYDTIKYIKRYFFNMNFAKRLNIRARHIKLNKDNFKDVSELLERMNQQDEKRFYIVVDSIMCTKHKGDMNNLFNKIQDHLIEVKLREIRDMCIRPFYKGRYSIDTIGNFNARLRNFLGDKVEKDIPWDKYVKLL